MDACTINLIIILLYKEHNYYQSYNGGKIIMCGRYQFMSDEENAEIKRILQKINNKYHGEVAYSTGEIFPTNTVPMIALRNGEIDYSLMSWGLPKWDGKGVVINARSETAGEKKMFATSLQQRRCVVPAWGFFEWQKKDITKPKDKFLFRSDENSMMYMAAIYNTFQVDKNVKEYFAILARDANLSMADIHDRMPVVLHEHEVEKWLNDKDFIDFAFHREDIILTRTAV